MSDLDWLAGLLEADGTFQITRTTDGFQYRVQLSQAKHNVINLDAMEKVLVDHGFRYRRYVFTNRKHPVEAIYIYRKAEVRRLLTELSTRLRGTKKAQAEHMINAIDGLVLPEDAKEMMRVYKTKPYDTPRGGRKAKKIPESEYVKISRKRETMTLQQIAREYGVTKQAVWYVLRKMRKNRES